MADPTSSHSLTGITGGGGGDTGQGSQEVTSMLNSAPYPHVIWDGRTTHEAPVSITVEWGALGDGWPHLPHRIREGFTCSFTKATDV